MSRSPFGLLALVSLAVLAACSAPPGSARSTAAGPTDAFGASLAASQIETAGGITLSAMWEDPGRFLVFHITLDNHMVDLDGITLSGATLRNSRGDSLSAAPWTAPAGGHHRDGWLTFTGDPATFLAGATWVELTLPPIGPVSVAPLRWSTAAS